MITALSLKYRPQKFSELDSTDAREALIKIFKSGKIPQAFLFSGPKGIGKTSAARIVAKAVNCRLRQQPTTNNQLPTGKEKLEAGSGKLEVGYEPCNECATCLSITNGTNLDVLEIDAASNRGIDDIRGLREKIRLAPTSCKYKVYIIDEVHMLTNEAFNALLKTLEEPPAHVVFILCTTAPEKLPETITSRCTKINFKKATRQEIQEKLEKITKKEEFSFKDEDLKKIAKAAEGSFRDAVKILEQAAISSADEVIGTLGEFKPEIFLSLISQKNTKEAILWLNQAVEQGANLRILTEEILRLLREALLLKYGVELEENPQQFNNLPAGRQDLTIEQLRQLINLFSKAAFELKNAVIPQLPLEMAVVEWGEQNVKCQMSNVKSGEDSGENENKEKGKKKSGEPEPEDKTQTFSSSSTKSLGEILSKWPEILEKVKPLNHSVQAFLKASQPLSLEENFLTLEVFYKFHKDQLEQEKCRQIVEKVCQEVLSLPLRLKFVLGQKPKKMEVENKPTQSPENLPKIEEEDIIKIAEEIFNNSQEIKN